jgi:polar amino acid transport system substrate-binding protein
MSFARFTAFALLALAAAAAPCAPLKLCYDDAPQPPWTMPDETGLNIELLKRTEKLLGEQFVLAAKPWKRCLEEARTGLVDGIIGGADSVDRREYVALPQLANGQGDAEQALYSDVYLVFIRKKSGASWDGRQFVNLQGDVAAQRGYIVVDDLRQRGHSVKDSIKSAEEGLRMLAAGAADAAVLLGVDGEKRLAANPRFQSRIAQSKWVFSAVPLYLLISRKTYEADPYRINRVWQGIRTVRATASYRKLEDAAGKVRLSQVHKD